MLKLALVFLFFLNGAPVARAESTPLPLVSFREMLVDHDHGQVFISGGAGNDSLVVTDLAGGDMRTIPGLPGAVGMALVGDLLFVARERGAAIDVVDAEALELLVTLELPRPTSGVLAYAGGRLWTHTACGDAPPELISLDPATGLVVQREQVFRCPLFRSSPLHPHLLFVGELGVTPTRHAFAFEASVWQSPAVGVFEFSDESSFLADLRTADHGRTLLGITTDQMGEAREYEVGREQKTVVYPARGSPTAVAQTSAGGGYVAIGVTNSEPNVHVYREGTTEHASAHTVGAFEGLQERGLAFVPETGTILAVTKTREPEALFLDTIPGPTAARSSVELELSDAVVGPGETVTVTARVDAPADVSANLTIYAQPYGGDRIQISSEPVAGGGSVSKEVTVDRNTTVVAHWAGTDAVLPATSVPLRVAVPLTATCTLNGGYGSAGRYRLYRLDGAAPRFTGAIRPAIDGAALGFVVERRPKKEWVSYAAETFETRPDGTRGVRFLTKKPGNYRVRTVSLEETYASDVSPWRYFRVVR